MGNSFIEFDYYELSLIQEVLSDYEIETGDILPSNIKLKFKSAIELLLNGGVGGVVFVDGKKMEKSK